MHHRLPIAELGPRGEAMAHAIQTCVHCGFCLPTCPTYVELGQEMDSPRGRIFLMKEVLEGNLAAEEAQPHIDRCLGCLACETHCPSGVPYGELISPYRALRRAQGEPGGDRLRRSLAAWTLPYPARFRWAMRLGRIGRALRWLTPRRLLPMLEMVPPSLPPAERLPEITPAEGPRRGRVALLAGCAQQVLAPEINAATLRVLARNGIETLVPPAQGCCGALSWHIGDDRRAVRFARRNLEAFPSDVDAVVTNAAGCGSAMHEYPLMFAGTEDQPRARQLAERTVDVSVYLQQVGLLPPPAVEPVRIAYHDACHLAHAQGVRQPPRQLLAAIPGVELVEIPESELCCGSAGTYNIDQPEIAAGLGVRKAESIRGTGAELVALGNIGCLVQIERFLRTIGHPLPVLHTLSVLDRAYRGLRLVGRSTASYPAVLTANPIRPASSA